MVLGLRVLKVTKDKDQREILVLRVQKVMKVTPVLKIMIMMGNWHMNGKNVVNLGDPSDVTDASNKNECSYHCKQHTEWF